MKKKGLKILFLDECTISLDPTINKRWFIKGDKPIQIVNGSFRKTHAIGIMSENERFVSFVDKVNSKSMKTFFSKVIKKFGKALIVLDNAPWHKSKKIREYANKIGIILDFLPPYSPELNPIEQLWRKIKMDVTYRLHADMDDVKGAVRSYIRKCGFGFNMFEYFS
jgi:transposase